MVEQQYYQNVQYVVIKKETKSKGNGVNIPLEFSEQLAERITQTNY